MEGGLSVLEEEQEEMAVEVVTRRYCPNAASCSGLRCWSRTSGASASVVVATEVE